jgi:hypothetical protein
VTDRDAAVVLAEQVASGELTVEAAEWLAHGFRAWLAAGADVELARCLRLPATGHKLALARRDYWLSEAAVRLGEGPTLWKRSRRLYVAALRLQNGIPAGESLPVIDALRRALAAGALPDTVDGLHRVLREST